MAKAFGVIGALALLAIGARGDDGEFAQVRKQVLPEEKEAWESVPWHTDLAVARREAARDGKLLFLWAMNGHPCGAV